MSASSALRSCGQAAASVISSACSPIDLQAVAIADQLELARAATRIDGESRRRQRLDAAADRRAVALELERAVPRRGAPAPERRRAQADGLRGRARRAPAVRERPGRGIRIRPRRALGERKARREQHGLRRGRDVRGEGGEFAVDEPGVHVARGECGMRGDGAQQRQVVGDAEDRRAVEPVPERRERGVARSGPEAMTLAIIGS